MDELAINGKTDYFMKILLVGDSGVGKTCLFTRFVRDKFNETKATVMPNGANRIIHSECETIDLEVWDTAGVHSSRTLTRAFYNGADGIIIAYDVTNIETFNSIKQWLCDIQSNGGRETPKVLLGNKCDLINEKKVETDAAKMFADNYGIKFYEVSAKTCLNVEKAFFDVVCEIRNRQKSNPETENYEIENRMTYNEKRDLIANLEIRLLQEKLSIAKLKKELLNSKLQQLSSSNSKNVNINFN